jgi:hypothetical protein
MKATGLEATLWSDQLQLQAMSFSVASEKSLSLVI